MMFRSVGRLGAAAAGAAAARLPTQSCSSAEECPMKNHKALSYLRSNSFPLEEHWHGKVRVRVLKVRREGVFGQHSVSEYTVDTKLLSDDANCFTDEDNSGIVSTDTQKNSVYLVAKRTPAASPEQFAVDLARHFLNEYSLHAVEIDVREQPWQRVLTNNAPHDHGFVRASPTHAVVNVKMTRNRRDQPEVTSGIRGMTVLKTTQSGWENYLHDRYTLLKDTDDRCMSTEISAEWKYKPMPGGHEPDYGAVRAIVEAQIKQGFFGPAQGGVYSHSVQATVYDIGCLVLEEATDVAKFSINTPNLHYLPAMLLNQLGEKWERDIFIPTNEPSGNISCTVCRDLDGADDSFGDSHSAFTPHLEAIKSDIRAALVNLKSNACPMAMRVAWHASGTYNRNTGTGGSDGATMRYEPEFSDEANNGLTMMIDMLKPVKDKNPKVSTADIWALAGASAIEFLGGPRIPFAFGRVDATGKEKGCPAMAIPENGRLPDASQGAQHLRDVFGRQGFSDRDIVALSGGHTLGRCHKVRSGYDGPWTDDPLGFDNSYFRNLMNLEWQRRNWEGKEQYEDVATKRLIMLPTDMALKTDPVFSKIAREYADSQDLFFKDFAIAFSKLLHNGCKNKPQELEAPAPVAIRPAPKSAKPQPTMNVSKEKAGLEFREYAMHGSTERMKPFADLADVNEQEANSGRTALHKASFWGHIETITYLLDVCRVNPNVQDLSGDTALHDAVRFGHAPLVHKLLEVGADKTITNNDGKTPEDLAKDYGKPAIAAKLAAKRS